MSKNSFEKKHQNDAKVTKNGSKTGGVEVVNSWFFKSNVSSLPRSGQCFDKNMPHYGALVTFQAWSGQFLPGMGRALGSGQGVGMQDGPEGRKGKK